MKELFDQVSLEASRNTTKKYSTSFSLGIKFLNKELHDPIYAVYGYVRFADEIVDTFHDYDKKRLLDKFRSDTFEAIEDGISLNPILNSFQWVVNKFAIPHELITTFLDSMEMDLFDHEYSQELYEKYILGSAEVVGLMCLKIFVFGNEKEYERLKPYAMKLGSAFQKINFLRDFQADVDGLGRVYFPGLDLSKFDTQIKSEIEKDIAADFAMGYEGIKQLPKGSRFGVYMSYVYYSRLLKKIQNTTPEQMLNERVRIPNKRKYALFVGSYFKHSFNML